MNRPRLGTSYRRALLDAEMERLVPDLTGIVLDVGGKRTLRGRFRPPESGVKRWILLNVSWAEGPDIVATAEALPVRDASVDRILCKEVIQYVDHYDAMLAEFRRVLVPGGRVFLSAPLLHRLDHSLDRQRFSAARLGELLERAGLRVQSVAQQGLFFTTLADMLRHAAAQVRSRMLRAALAMPLLPLGAGLCRLDRMPAVARSPFLSSYTTGYLVTAEKA